MAKAASQVRVALTGSIWFTSNLSATIPANLAAVPSDFMDLGYTTEDGVTFTMSRDTEDITAWQTGDILRKLVTAEPKTAKFTLQQVARSQWLAAMGGTVTLATSGPPAVYRWEPASGVLPEGILLIDFADNGINYRFGFRRAQQSAEVEFSLVRGDSLQLPTEWTAVAPSSGLTSFFMDTDDPAFASVTDDITPPTAGTIAASSITTTGFTLTATGASDAVGLHATPYAFTVNDGTTWTEWQAGNTYAASGLTTGTGYVCQHKVRDTSGNVTFGARIAVKTS